MKIVVLKNEKEIGNYVGKMFVDELSDNSKCVLGLATGSSPETTYQYIVDDYKENKTDWSKVTTFNLDEYVGLEPTHSHSYRYFMNDKLFNHINIDKKNTFIPENSMINNPEQYDELIAKHGGIDLQLLGLGVNGHIGFNEPGSSFDSITRVVDLTQSTIDANARFFESKKDVPTKAISMGLKTIAQAKKIVLIAYGDSKVDAVYNMVKGEVSEQWPCSFLQLHKDVTLVIDEQAAKKI